MANKDEEPLEPLKFTDKVVILGDGADTVVSVRLRTGQSQFISRHIPHDEMGEKFFQWLQDAPKDVTMPLLAKIFRETEGKLWEKLQ